MKSYLQLENGVIFEGNAFGKIEDTVGEVVFNTGMTGYQELMTDPSYYGQIVTMTYPLIGNYGINLEDDQSDSPKIKGLIVREKCDYPNNFRCELDLDGYLKYNNIMGLEGIDTRALTKVIRETGTLKGLMTHRRLPQSKLMDILNEYDNSDAVRKVGTKESYTIKGSGKHIAVIDFGIKNNILESFKNKGLKITVFPSNASADEVIGVNPNGIFLSNGPGDPKDYPDIIENVKIMIDKKPTIGICLGHQLIALALGGDTGKLAFGHRGCNHPVKDIKKDIVYITSQNHGYVVNKVPQDMEVTHISLNDKTIEGLRHITKPILTVQFHPEASPGPDDAHGVFDEFMELL
ncbi:glutamine-hydrolyzing carbamoyl-phosphate synthase small subunit [Alkalibaculum sp. M08DMB]|uniref:Carbamoyl phosphate synthase small chain n=1 Tax=Alkalibaculum sporogenes TaxID=2655001 RepID=A0A6A7KC43_9FIRM|nr:carbamoyl phosphate synthase small subunit [Alkalibaculum sporogenes]MPW26871.1 glutamine-hydrolyzing carbamoyl-phosphate synthase small subunit [Alkalibaculum sporogenes]